MTQAIPTHVPTALVRDFDYLDMQGERDVFALFHRDGECDFTAAFAQRLPIIIMMNVFGLPDRDTSLLLSLTERIVRGAGTADAQAIAQQQAYAELARYIAEQVIPARRAHPGDDIFSALLTGEVEGGRHLADEEIVSLGSLLMAAGLDTVANEDTEYHDVQICTGDIILIPTPAAGIDAKHFSDPFTVDFDRKDKRPLTFGTGVHRCIGALLARTELRVFLTEWLQRIPEFRVQPGKQPRAIVGKVLAVRDFVLEFD